jgi:hypothetical protein
VRREGYCRMKSQEIWAIFRSFDRCEWVNPIAYRFYVIHVFIRITLPCLGRIARGEEVGLLSVAQYLSCTLSDSETDALGCRGTLAILNRFGIRMMEITTINPL